MKKFLIYIFAFFVISQQLFADCDPIHIDGRVAAFYPTSHLFREIYSDCLAAYEVEAGKAFWNNYEIWGDVSWLSAEGHTKTFHNKTRFRNTNFSLGGKYLWDLCDCTQLYFGLGINAAYVHVHNDSHHVKRNVHKNGVGGVVKLGIYAEPIDHLLFELFVDYLYQRIHFERHVEIGGFKFGGGIGLIF